jgi:hypothetical protein
MLTRIEPHLTPTLADEEQVDQGHLSMLTPGRPCLPASGRTGLKTHLVQPGAGYWTSLPGWDSEVGIAEVVGLTDQTTGQPDGDLAHNLRFLPPLRPQTNKSAVQ